MRKRIVIILLMLPIVLSIVLHSVGNAAVTTVFFTSIEDRLLPLVADEMPVRLNGTVFVHYESLRSSDLGLTVFYSRSSDIVQVTDGKKELRFHIKKYATYDGSGAKYQYVAVIRGEIPFLPVAFVCDFFGLNYRVVKNPNLADIVRITTGNEHYDDTDFVRLAYTRMSEAYAEYTATLPTQTPTPTITPSPTPKPLTDISIMLYIYVLGDKPPEIPSFPVTFMFSADSIRANADFVRKAIGTGNSVGIVADEDDSYSASFAMLREVAEYYPDVFGTETETTPVSGALKFLQLIKDGDHLTFHISSDDSRYKELITSVKTALSRMES